MSSLRFEWDVQKAQSNFQKHGVTFDEASSAFQDDNGIEFYDDEHAAWEDRFLFLGISFNGKLLLVCHCFKESEGVIRIISARKATRFEALQYRSN